MQNHFYIFILCWCIISCNSEDDSSSIGDLNAPYNWETHVPFETSYPTFTMETTEDFLSVPENLGPVSLSETSGLAFSINNPGMLWAHNDSGHTNSISLIEIATAEVKARYKITGTNNIDWEDMEIAINPNNNKPYLYVGDIGDNDEKRPHYTIYKFQEPTYQDHHAASGVTIWEPEDFTAIKFTYPDGSHDAETLLVDPTTQDIFLVTKRDVVSTLYVAPFPQDGTTTLYKAGAFSFKDASGGNVALDGKKILIKNRQEIFYWSVSGEETLVQTLEKTPIKAPYVGEPQGEAICYDTDHNYFTLSEALNNTTPPTLYKYNLKSN